MSPPARLLHPDRAWKLWALVVVIVVLAVPTWAVLISADDDPMTGYTIGLEGTWEMAERYSPILRFSIAERVFPAPVEYFLERSALVDAGTQVVVEHPSMDDLEGAGPGLFLDFKGDAIGSYEQDRSIIAPTVYARTDLAGGRAIVQYWMFYVYNQGTYNSHEGDWEMIQVTMAPDGSRPEQVVLSRHHEVSRVEWTDLVEMNGTHPAVLVSAGSHANYLPSEWQRASGDRADGGGEEWGPEDYALVSIGTGPGGDEPPWLRFSGHWGQPAGGLGGTMGQEGPPGPRFREGGRMWSGVEWYR
jgi:hypothetical protein